MSNKPLFYNLYLSKVTTDKIIFSSNIVIWRQRLVIDRKRCCVSYESYSPWKLVTWRKSFDDFSKVECRLSRAGNNSRNVATWATHIFLKNGETIPIKPPFFELTKSTKDTELSLMVAEYLNVAHGEHYSY